VQISAKADYALRALCVLAAAPQQCAVKADDIASARIRPTAVSDD
jgi:DNA-binding IscR family transcriptional regulator